jgi:hypothetical protein
MRLILAIWAVTLCGCGSDDGGPSPMNDLSVPLEDLGTTDLSVPDLSAPDLQTGPPPTSDFCKGTALAGIPDDGGIASDCARQFFLRFAECFRPAGACSSGGVIGHSETCWEDGAFYQRVGLISQSYGYGMNGRRCLVNFARYPATTGVDRYCLSSTDYECRPQADLGSTPLATYDGQVFTCPDGTAVTIGPNLGNCPALNALFQFPCDHNKAGDYYVGFP